MADRYQGHAEGKSADAAKVGMRPPSSGGCFCAHISMQIERCSADGEATQIGWKVVKNP